MKDANQFAAEMDHFSHSVIAGCDPKTTGEEGLRDVRIMQALYKSARERRPIALDATNAVPR